MPVQTECVFTQTTQKSRLLNLKGMPVIHRSVQLTDVLHWLDPTPGGLIVDATLGVGGHSAAIADRVGPSGRVIAFDRDPSMIALAHEKIAGKPIDPVHAAFDQLAEVLDQEGITAIDGILADLGFCSDQIEHADRGFSFQREGPLDMRYDPTSELTAAIIVNQYEPQMLADLFYRFGGEHKSRAIADRIAERRRDEPIETTSQLAAIVREALGARSRSERDRIDPSTRVFQALRIAVNDELGILKRFLQTAPGYLKPGGRFVVISFHSLEDEQIKSTFKDDPRLKMLTKKPVIAGDLEVRRNPRARSAKLRAAERVLP